MLDAWDKLQRYGLPDGALRPAPQSIDFAEIRAALAALDVAALDAVGRAVLLSWLEGWHHHWPARFERELGDAGDTLRQALWRYPVDRDRYLKLRRIATENLAGVL